MLGIYKISNKINGKLYIGMSNDIDRRFMEHRTPKNIINKTTTLAKAFRKYGIQNFSFELLEECICEDDLIEREMYYIKLTKPHYNMNDGGLGNTGHKLSNELKEKLSVYGKKQWQNMDNFSRSKVIKNNLKGPKKGHAVSQETRLKIKNSLKDRKQPLETVRKRAKSISISAIGNKNANKKVCQMLDGRVINVFPSLKDAATEIGICSSNITNVLKGKQKSAGGFYWKLWSVETNGDECSRVGGKMSSPSKYEAAYKAEEIVQSLEIANLRVNDKGFIQLAQRSGQFKELDSKPVYEGQYMEDDSMKGFHFEWKNKKSDILIGFVAWFKLLNGYEAVFFMTVEQLKKHGLRYSKTFSNTKTAKYSLWETDFEAMASKTVLKLLLSKFAPLSVDMQRAVISDQALINDVDTIDVSYVDNSDVEIDKEAERVRMLIQDAVSVNDLVKLQPHLTEGLFEVYETKFAELSEKDV